VRDHHLTCVDAAITHNDHEAIGAASASYYTLQAGSYATDLGPFNKKASSLDLFVIV